MPNESLNEDFAIDDLCFVPPRRVTDFNLQPRFLILLKSGEFLYCEQVALREDRIEVIDPRFEQHGLAFSHEQLISVLAPQADPEPEEGAAFVMMRDGSVVRADLGESPVLVEWDGEAIEQDAVTGWWSGRRVIYPEPEDWSEQPRAVIAYPACRILVRNFEMENGQLSIAGDQLERRQQNAELDEGAPDPQGDLAETGLAFQLNESPSVWFRQPPALDSTAGLVRMRDGQQFVLGGESGFSLESTNDGGVTIRRGDKRLTLEMDRIAVLRWP